MLSYINAEYTWCGLQWVERWKLLFMGQVCPNQLHKYQLSMFKTPHVCSAIIYDDNIADNAESRTNIDILTEKVRL